MTPMTRVRLLKPIEDLPRKGRILRIREVRGDRADVLELQVHGHRQGKAYESPTRCALNVPLDQLEEDTAPYRRTKKPPPPPPPKPGPCPECFGSGWTRIVLAFPVPQVRDVECGVCGGEGEVAA